MNYKWQWQWYYSIWLIGPSNHQVMSMMTVSHSFVMDLTSDRSSATPRPFWRCPAWTGRADSGQRTFRRSASCSRTSGTLSLLWITDAMKVLSFQVQWSLPESVNCPFLAIGLELRAVQTELMAGCPNLGGERPLSYYSRQALHTFQYIHGRLFVAT